MQTKQSDPSEHLEFNFDPQFLRRKANPILRSMMSQTDFTKEQLIQPLFAAQNIGPDEAISGLKGVHRQNIESLKKQIELDLKVGIKQFLLFVAPQNKFNETSLPQSYKYTGEVVSSLKQTFGSDIFLWVDICLCTYLDTGHCCFFESAKSSPNQHPSTLPININLPKTLQALSSQALQAVSAGADGVSPSDMMDGRTLAIRQTLNKHNFTFTPIMSYSTKFASNFYGPFRNAASSTPSFGDRKAYQLDVRDKQSALASSQRCAQEGADFLMLKPGMTSIDLLEPIKKLTNKPVGVYQVSGEYASLTFLEEKGLIKFNQGLWETWQVFKRAGAQYIISYGARLVNEVKESL